MNIAQGAIFYKSLSVTRGLAIHNTNKNTHTIYKELLSLDAPLFFFVDFLEYSKTILLRLKYLNLVTERNFVDLNV